MALMLVENGTQARNYPLACFNSRPAVRVFDLHTFDWKESVDMCSTSQQGFKRSRGPSGRRTSVGTRDGKCVFNRCQGSSIVGDACVCQARLSLAEVDMLERSGEGGNFLTGRMFVIE